jgi:hypothetical protein
VPPPETFPDFLWNREVRRGFAFLERGGIPDGTPKLESVVEYYRRRAPGVLPVLTPGAVTGGGPVRFEPIGRRPRGDLPNPGMANVRFVRLGGEGPNLDVVACDMMNGKVYLLETGSPEAGLRILADTIPNPAHAEVADLDGDGTNDLLIADLGNAYPTEDLVGTVVWLRGQPDGSFTPITLARELGRVADVQAADFDGDGDLDLVVAAFGWLNVGQILLLENRSTDPAGPVFVPTTLDQRDGTIHVPVADLNGDGRPDFIALISQEHEAVVAFLNRGDRTFEQRVLYEAPHPAFGSSGIQLVDMDSDGDLDVLLSNGDSLDSELLRPYHGIGWLENPGTYPFAYHRLASLYGAQRAVAGDIDGDGDLDITAVSFLPGNYYKGLRREMNLDAIIVLEQDAPGHFVRHTLETVGCDHATCDLGDYDGDGDLDLVVGNLFMSLGFREVGVEPDADWVTLRRNLGPAKPHKATAAEPVE